MRKILSVVGMGAFFTLLTSCATIQYSPGPSNVEESSPEATFYRMLEALRTGDVRTAKQWTLYSEFVNWDQVMREARSKPRKYRVKKILYKDATPQMFSSSMIYYTAADGDNYVVEFTRVNDKWYWGTRLNSGMARVIRARASASREAQKPQE